MQGWTGTTRHGVIKKEYKYITLNSNYEASSYKKKKYKKIKAYRKSVLKEPIVKACLLILDHRSKESILLA